MMKKKCLSMLRVECINKWETKNFRWKEIDVFIKLTREKIKEIIKDYNKYFEKDIIQLMSKESEISLLSLEKVLTRPLQLKEDKKAECKKGYYDGKHRGCYDYLHSYWENYENITNNTFEKIKFDYNFSSEYREGYYKGYLESFNKIWNETLTELRSLKCK